MNLSKILFDDQIRVQFQLSFSLRDSFARNEKLSYYLTAGYFIFLLLQTYHQN